MWLYNCCRLQTDGEDGRGDFLGGPQVPEHGGWKTLCMQENEAEIPQVCMVYNTYVYLQLLLCIQVMVKAIIDLIWILIHQQHLHILLDMCTCSAEQVNNLREVQALRRLNPHNNIIDLNEVIL